jgi:hypothetical protein
MVDSGGIVAALTALTSPWLFSTATHALLQRVAVLSGAVAFAATADTTSGWHCLTTAHCCDLHDFCV